VVTPGILDTHRGLDAMRGVEMLQQLGSTRALARELNRRLRGRRR
jgi:hypothetical protein